MVNRILLAFIAVLPILIYVTDHLVPSCFAFKPANLQQLAKANIDQFGDDIPGLMKHLVKDLQAEYGNIVGDYDDSKWVFNVAGGSTVRLSPFKSIRRSARARYPQTHEAAQA
jgi:hypothetical protein